MWSSMPIRDEQGNLIGFAKITRDITERREAQQALEETRARLFQSQKMEAVGQLTGGDRARLQQPARGRARQPRLAAQAPAG